MPYSPTRPIPPKDYAERAGGPLDPRDSGISIAAAKRRLALSDQSDSRQQRSIEMVSYHVENLPSWIRHHVGEAWSVFSSFIAQGGTEFCPEIDDSQDVCNRLASLPENLLDRLEPSFIGLEREADPEGYFRNWYSALSKRYAHDMKTVKLIYRTDYTKSYTHSALVVQKFIPEFAKFFDSLREFIGIQACLNSCWRQGDTYRVKWDLSVFERQIVWGGIAV